MKRIECLKLAGPQPKNNGYNHNYDIVAYPEGTPMMEVTLAKKRQIVMAAVAIDFNPNYRQQGSCNGSEPSLFLPEAGESHLPGKEICGGCRVRWHCLEEGMTDNNEGIWGGTSRPERRKIAIGRQILVDEDTQSLEKEPKEPETP